MKLNENVKFVLSGVYLYDIEACHYTIMKKMGLDMPGVNKDDKTQRNIEIGKIMRRNPKLTSILRTTTASILDEYILKNDITEQDIIVRQYDGILTIKKLRQTNIGHIPLDLRKVFETFIISIDRNSYLALDGNKEITIKGVPYRYNSMDRMLEKLCKINFTNKQAIFLSLQNLKNEILNSEDPVLFAIPIKENTFSIFLRVYNEVEVTEPTLKIIDTQDINKEKYFKFYLEPFTKSIVFQFVK